MQKPPPWVRGPIELLQHAESHFREKSDLDKRIALISFDNAIEVAITTYLLLDPKIRGGKAYPGESVKNWRRSFHTLIEFFMNYLKENDYDSDITCEEIIWYHSLRNELYHSGNGMVPEVHCVEGVRNAAFEIIQLLYNVNLTTLFNSSQRIISQPEVNETATAQTIFIQLFIEMDRTLLGTALALGLDAEHLKKRGNPFAVWRTLREQLGEASIKFEEIVQKSIKVRNEIVNTGTTLCSEQELTSLTNGINELINYLHAYGFSFNILPTLKERYGDWVNPQISSVRIIQKKGMAFLEVTRCVSGLHDEEILRTNLDFISSGNEEDYDMLLFSSIYSAQYNADRFFDELDLYSIIMTGIGDSLFTEKGLYAAANYCGADKADPLGNITRSIPVIIENDL